HPLGRFTVTLEADDARFLDIDDDASRARRWSIVPLALPSPFVGAVVLEAAAPTVTLRSHVR
ncbi:MAG: hypothetical protein MUF53_01010, partial [Gemmatimonadaceae bacterium]|nr:hypothetical protein [Gemmatimonadaceae bacterium]